MHNAEIKKAAQLVRRGKKGVDEPMSIKVKVKIILLN